MDIFFFFNDTATTEIYTLSLHDALPISDLVLLDIWMPDVDGIETLQRAMEAHPRHLVIMMRSEEHTSELQSQSNLVCRLLLEKKNEISMASAASSTPLLDLVVAVVL